MKMTSHQCRLYIKIQVYYTIKYRNIILIDWTHQSIRLWTISWVGVISAIPSRQEKVV